MAQIILEIPDDMLEDVEAGLCERGDYRDTIFDTKKAEMIPNPISRSEYAKSYLMNIVRGNYLTYRRRKELKNVKDDINIDAKKI